MKMNKMLFLAALLTPAMAFAQTATTAPATTPSSTAAPVTAAKGANFDAHKSKVLEKMGERISEMQKKQQCVQGATSADAMKACMPAKGGGKGKKGCSL